MYSKVTAKLLHYVKSRPMTDFNHYRMQNPYSFGRFGALPYDWLSGVDTFGRASVTEQVHDAFRDYSQFLKDAFISSNSKYDKEVHGGNKLLERLKEILNREDIELEYDAHGKFKDCTKITVGDKSYALSTMRKNIYSVRMGMTDVLYPFLAYKRGSHGRFARPFMANYYDTGEYILSKYIEDSHPTKVDLNNILGSRQYITHTDANEITNSKKGIMYDGGGIVKNDRYIPDPKVRFNWSRFASKLFSERSLILKFRDFKGEQLSRPDREFIQDYLLKLKRQGVDLCSEDARELLNELTLAERDFAIKLIRILRKTRKLKNELIQTGEYEQYKKLLTEDLRYNYPFDAYSDYISIHRCGYPKLVADELGVSNIPQTLDEETYFLFSAGLLKDAIFKKLFTKEQVKEFLLNKTSGFSESCERLAELYGLQKEYNAHKMRVISEYIG